MHHNLNKYDVIVGLEIPDFRVIPYYKPFSRDPNIVTNGTLVLELSCYSTHAKRFGQLTLVLL